jgi:hypothetical protein
MGSSVLHDPQPSITLISRIVHFEVDGCVGEDALAFQEGIGGNSFGRYEKSWDTEVENGQRNMVDDLVDRNLRSRVGCYLLALSTSPEWIVIHSRRANAENKNLSSS